jgi:hypothetical protein
VPETEMLSTSNCQYARRVTFTLQAKRVSHYIALLSRSLAWSWEVWQSPGSCRHRTNVLLAILI